MYLIQSDKSHPRHILAWGCLWLALLIPAVAQSQGLSSFSTTGDELLEPHIAFAPSIEAVTAESIRVRFDIADGYYLYRKRLSVAAPGDNLSIDSIETPSGIMTTDDYFGDTEIYRESVAFDVRYSDDLGNRVTEIQVNSQGCADAGVCYAPQEQMLSVTLPSLQSASSAGAGISSLLPKKTAGLDQLLGGGTSDELLPPDIAFVPSVSIASNDTVEIRFAIEPGYYLYHDKFAARFESDNAVEIKSTAISKGKMKDDAYFGRVEVHRDIATVTLTLASASAGEQVLLMDYQGCADIGVCFPPQTTSLPVTLSALGDDSRIRTTDSAKVDAAGSILAAATAVTGGTATRVTTELSEQDGIARALSTSSLWVIALMFFGLGLLLSFTPCVFPMIPILSSIIVGQGESITTRRAFILSTVYVLAMAVTYTIAGIIVGLSGENIQIWFQNPWVLSAFALIFVLLSLSMFGFYELQMPAAIQNKLNSFSNRQQGGTYMGAGIMGLLSALIVGPCVTAPLVGALIFIADTGNATVGGVALFFLGLGMGAPLIVIGASCGTLLPRAGAWMETTKAVFGVLMLGLAIWMLSRFIPASATLALAAALAIVSGIYLGALDAVPAGSTGWRKLFKGAGLVSLVYGVILLLGAASGGHDLLQPLDRLITAQGTQGNEHSGEIEFQRIKSLEDLQAVVASAKQNDQAVMLDFYADWCISCKEMEKFTFSDAEVQKRLKDVVLVQADVTKNDSTDKALLKHFNLFGPPAILFYTPIDDEIRNARVVGYMSADDFSTHLDKFL